MNIIVKAGVFLCSTLKKNETTQLICKDGKLDKNTNNRTVGILNNLEGHEFP